MLHSASNQCRAASMLVLLYNMVVVPGNRKNANIKVVNIRTWPWIGHLHTP